MDATTVDFTLLYILIEVQMPCFSQNLSPLCLNLTPVQLLQLLSNVHQYFERSSPVYSILHPVIEKYYPHLLLPRLQWCEFLATAISLCDLIGHIWVTCCYHSWFSAVQ